MKIERRRGGSRSVAPSIALVRFDLPPREVVHERVDHELVHALVQRLAPVRAVDDVVRLGPHGVNLGADDVEAKILFFTFESTFVSDASFARLSITTSRGGGRSFVVRETSSRESCGLFVGSLSGRASLRVAPHPLLFAFAFRSRRWHALHTGFPACSPVVAVLHPLASAAPHPAHVHPG